MRRVVVALFLLACAAPALAAPLSAKDAKKQFFGYDMMGRIEGTNTQWRECVNPSGGTVYWIEGEKREGTLRIRDDGALCFSYPNPQLSDEDCFTAERRGASNWRFVYEFAGGDTFVTTKTRRVKECPKEEAPIS
jgi:hypothetical protein